MILSANMLAFLTAQYGHETGNSLFYAALWSWAEMRGLDGTAAFFAAQSKDEQEHAEKVLAYIHDRNEQLGAISVDFSPTVPADFAGLFTLAQAREQATTAQIYALKAQAMAENDYATCAWLDAPGGLILEQIEEERVIQNILDRIAIRGTDPAAVHDIDVWIAGIK
jgi:ferritin